MILHIAGLDKFIPPFIDLIYEEFDNKNHRFWLVGSTKKYPVTRRNNIYICKRGFWSRLKAYAKLIYQMHASKKIIVHGLFSRGIELILALFPWLLPKCHWVIWGNDLYRYQQPRIGIKNKFQETIRQFIIKRIGHLVTYIPGDVELAKKWYDAQGKHHECLMYTSNTIDQKILETSYHNEKKDSKTNILVGNSADPSNNHIEILVKLLPYKDKDIRIYVPLSYGNRAHAKKVMEKGAEWFGEKFIPVTDFLPFQEYLFFLTSIEIAIFNHKRQQAMGNIITLLGLGKSVYLRNDVSQWSLLSRLGIKLKTIENLDLIPLTFSERSKNINIIKSYFSKEKLLYQLSKIFEK